VGPRSAGADPGPACYGAGGSEPTLTDAHLVLGRLDPEAFLGGEIRLDVGLARTAIERAVARPLGIDVEEAARGIVAVADANMAGAIRATAARHGDDLRGSVLVAGGGAGPLHAVQLAAELGMPAVCVPRTPGLLSALGLLATDLRHDLSGPLLAFADELDAARLERAFGDLEVVAADRLASDRVEAHDRRLERAIDLRAIGQEWTLTVPVVPGEPVARIVERFHAQHERVYGHAAHDQPVESVAVRIVATGVFPRPMLRHGASPAIGVARERSRRAWFAEAGAFVETRVIDRGAIGPGDRLAGPAIVEQLDTTVLVPPGYAARIAALDSLVIERSHP
jgi:N-methylhydantoinase A